MLALSFAAAGGGAARADDGLATLATLRTTATETTAVVTTAIAMAATGVAASGSSEQATDIQIAGATSGKKKRQRLTDEEVEQLTAAAEGGDAEAQYKLGMMYHNGGGKSHTRDYEEAMKWLRLSADQGNVLAEDRVGSMYYLGEGVPKDPAEAAHWYRMAAEKGNAHAQWQLVDMYQRGDGVPRDLAESKKWAQMGRRGNGVARARIVFSLVGLALLAFALGLFALQYDKLTGWQHFCVAVFVHAGGAFLVVNSLITYGFWIVVPHCSFNFLAPACVQFTDPHTRSIVNAIGSYAMANLILRFMAGVGIVLDLLAGWYAVYLWRVLFRRGRGMKATTSVARAAS